MAQDDYNRYDSTEAKQQTKQEHGEYYAPTDRVGRPAYTQENSQGNPKEGNGEEKQKKPEIRFQEGRTEKKRSIGNAHDNRAQT